MAGLIGRVAGQVTNVPIVGHVACAAGYVTRLRVTQAASAANLTYDGRQRLDRVAQSL